MNRVLLPMNSENSTIGKFQPLQRVQNKFEIFWIAPLEGWGEPGDFK